jgi:hypothetical protein
VDVFKTKKATSDKEREGVLVKALDRRKANEATPEGDKCIITNALKTGLTKCQNRRKKEAAERKKKYGRGGRRSKKKKRKCPKGESERTRTPHTTARAKALVVTAIAP